MGLGPSRLRNLTWIRCRTPPFLLLPIPRFVGRWPAVVGLSARRRGHRQPDRLGLAVHSRASVLCPRRIGLTSAPSTDRSMLSGWIADLERARRALGRLIRRLREAAGKGDLEAARQGHDPSGPD